MMFIQWVFAQAGVSDLLPIKTASCGALMRAAKAAGNWLTKGYQPGDVVIYDFPGGAATDHCGIIENVGTSTVTAIEGNTSVSGSQSNGGVVCRKTWPLSQVVGAVRPNYEMENEDMDVENLTESQLIRLAERMQAALEEAKALGITDGSSPNAFCTRAQAAVMVKRAAK